jgi:hypothetical protein
MQLFQERVYMLLSQLLCTAFHLEDFGPEGWWFPNHLNDLPLQQIEIPDNTDWDFYFILLVRSSINESLEQKHLLYLHETFVGI